VVGCEPALENDEVCDLTGTRDRKQVCLVACIFTIPLSREDAVATRTGDSLWCLLVLIVRLLPAPGDASADKREGLYKYRIGSLL